MLKIVNAVLVMVLFLAAITTASLIGKQNTNKTVVATSKNYFAKKMENLVVKNDLQKYGIEIITSTDPSFGDELKRYVGNEDSTISLIESAKPFVFFIKNNSQKEIIGVSLRWKFGSNGENLEFPQIEANPGVLMGMKPLDPKMIGKTSLINSKASKLFTYFKDIIEQQIALANISVNNSSGGGNSNNSSQTNELSLNSQKAKLSSGYTDFSVAIDGIVFDDGAFVGTDQNLFFQTLGGVIQARKDILTYFQDAKSTGKRSTDVLHDILTRTSNISVNSREMHANNRMEEQVKDNSYNNYLKNFRNEIMKKRSVMSDDYIIEQFQAARVSDFITLHKEDNF